MTIQFWCQSFRLGSYSIGALGLLATASAAMAQPKNLPPFPPQNVYAVGHNIWIAEAFPRNGLGKHDNQTISGVVAPNDAITAAQAVPCGNRWSFGGNDPNAVLIEDPSMRHSGVFNIAHNPHNPQASDWFWLWNDNGGTYPWSMKLVTGYVQLTNVQADDDAAIVKCKHEASKDAQGGSQSQFGSTGDDDDNPNRN